MCQIIFFRVSKTYNWTKFKNVARLEKKYDDTLTEYFRSFYAMCKRLCGQPLTEEEGKNNISSFYLKYLYN